jgi:hypothetical protein
MIVNGTQSNLFNFSYIGNNKIVDESIEIVYYDLKTGKSTYPVT